jgi:hypothetical protein
MIRRLLLLAGVAALVWRRIRRSRAAPVRASLGYRDGSTIVLERGAPELERLVGIAREAFR